jgi:hypothetical protein
VLKNKNVSVTTASRKPLFNENQTIKKSPPKHQNQNLTKEKPTHKVGFSLRWLASY